MDTKTSMESDALTLALVILDLEGSAGPQSLDWLLHQQRAVADPALLQEMLPGVPSLMGRWIARAVGTRIAESERARFQRLLQQEPGTRYVERVSPTSDRYALRSTAREDAHTFASSTLALWESMQPPDPEADAPHLLRFLFLRPDHATAATEMDRYFSPWSTTPAGAAPATPGTATESASMAQLRARHDAVRRRRVRALIDYVTHQGWVSISAQEIRLTTEGAKKAASLPEDWR